MFFSKKDLHLNAVERAVIIKIKKRLLTTTSDYIKEGGKNLGKN